MIHRIGIFGGSFNPITKSHLKIAKTLISDGLLHEVWFFPCYYSYHRKTLQDGKHRTTMCELAIDEDANSFKDRIKVCPFEIDNKLTLESSDIMDQFFKSEYNTADRKFYFIIGEDNAFDIHNWTGWERLLEMMTFVVIPRINKRDEDIKSLDWLKDSKHIYYEKYESDEVSSTKIRESLKEGNKSPYIHDNVYEYIIKNNLFN